MARPSTFTAAEDRILLRYPGAPAPVVNAALQDAGFPPRDARQLSRRRTWLNRQKAQPAVERESEITAIEQKRLALQEELAELDARRHSVRQQLIVSDQELRRLVNGIPDPDDPASDTDVYMALGDGRWGPATRDRLRRFLTGEAIEPSAPPEPGQ